MKREGRQHGMVRTHRIIPSPWNLRSETRLVNQLNSPPTCGLFTKVQQKPTNHSKFTGKCGNVRCIGCHMHPAWKSKDKTKGTQKLNSRDLVSNYKMIVWRVVDGRADLNFSGFSGTGILDHLADDYVDDDDDDDDDVADDVYDHDRLYDIHDDDDKTRENVNNNDEKDDGEIQEVTSFYDVGMAFDQVEDGDEGWCLVGET